MSSLFDALLADIRGDVRIDALAYADVEVSAALSHRSIPRVILPPC